MRVVEGKSVEDYVRESRSMAKLFNQVDMCDNMLRDMEQTLKVWYGMVWYGIECQNTSEL